MAAKEEKNSAFRIRRIKKVLRTMFWEGQHLEAEHEVELENASDLPKLKRFLLKNRRPIGLFLPLPFWWAIWWSLAIRYNLFEYFKEKYFMSVTMVFGALVAGATSEGGGAVAFPVMTMGFQIPPTVARDFALMIQTCGMTAAAFTIVFMKIQLEYHAIVFSSLGAVGGLIFGLHEIDHRLTPAEKKMGFVSVFFSFACALFILNRRKHRTTFTTIPNFKFWKAIVLLATGFLGGMVTAISGSGVDICSFSVLTLLFHISEKVATPTSVVLMAINTSVGFYWRQLIMDGIGSEAWEYLAVCVPIVVICAPLGSLISSHFHRLVLAAMIYILETVALISGFAIVRPGWKLALVSVGIIVGGFLFFFLLSWFGTRLLPLQNTTSGDGDPEKKKAQTMATKNNTATTQFKNANVIEIERTSNL